jgi:sarcosine oxidase
MKRYDCAVIGLGAAGSAALSALARAGVSVIGLDRHDPPHDKGSSHGETRLLRTAYSEGAFYVPMIRRAITLWRALERRTGARVFEQTGVVYVGPAEAPFIAGARDAARRWHLPLRDFRKLDGRIAVPADWLTLVDTTGGFLHPERAIAAFLKDARAHGAVVRKNCRAEALDRAGKEIIIAAGGRRIAAGRVIVTTGAWTRELLPELAPVTHVERRVLHWYEAPKGRYTLAAGFKPFAVATGDGKLFYGFAANAKGEVKVAEHDTAAVIDGPDALNRKISKADLAFIRALVARFMPELGRRTRSAVCMYPMSADEHFIIDRHPDDRRIVIGAGLSGHGFKFAPAIGEALANLALGQRQAVPIGAFALKRPMLISR